MPPLTTSSMLTYFVGFVFLYLVYTAYSLRNKIWCTFRRADRTKVEKWAKPDQGRIDFDGGWYHVEPSRTIIQWKQILGFFPMPVRALDFSYKSARAFNDEFKAEFLPVERKQLDMTDDIRGFMQGQQQALKGGQKKGILDQYMPLITIAAIAILGYMLWQQQKRIDLLGAGQNAIESMLGKLLAR